MQRLSPQEICQYIKQAMAPLHCHAESSDYDNQYGFYIRFDDDSDMRIDGWFKRHIQYPDTLESRLMVVRRELKERGHALHDWQGVPRNSAR